MTAKKSPSKRSAKSKLVLTRDFAAPRALVFAAWSQPEHLKKWSAPHGFKLPVSEGELRSGGAWRAVMVSPDGSKLGLGGVYRKVVLDKLLVFTHRWEGPDAGPETVVTVRFSDAPGGGTRIKFEQTGFASAASRDGHGGGWGECFERLDALLEKLQEKKSHGRRK
ncbi:MAG TPA: SRPBCC domain-containing protein [Lacunisphaera sp.]